MLYYEQKNHFLRGNKMSTSKDWIENGIWRPTIFDSFPQVQYGGTTSQFPELVGIKKGKNWKPLLKLFKDIERLHRSLSGKMTPGRFLVNAVRRIAPVANPHNLVKTQLQHTNNVVVVDEIFMKMSAEKKITATLATDGLVTNLVNVPLYVTGADCAPVAIFDPKKKVIGLFHSGWRGTASGVAVKGTTIMREKYSCAPEDLIVSIGPAISPLNFEVGPDIHEIFSGAFSAEEMEQISSGGKDGKFLLNLPRAIKLSLMKAGIPEKNIQVSDMTTGGDNTFPSARAAGGIDNIDGSTYILNLSERKN